MLAILPAAGSGKRMESVTNGGPKEMLPLGPATLLDRSLDEAAAAGCDERIVVWNRRKGPLNLEGVETVLQPKPRGLGDAVRLALRGRSEPAAILLPDVAFAPESPLARLLDEVRDGAAFAIAVAPVADELVSRYGIVERDEATGRIARLLEKPSPESTASRWAIASRFVLDRYTVAAIGVAEAAEEGEELDLVDLLIPHLRRGGAAVPLTRAEIRYDCGSPEGYARARKVFG